ncbi:hypothetical protein [Luteimonas lutimaris]|uniref:DUF456 domain-containing protein n=1 Tax=Luteimonas lutimaris TaxID=698645 RepID=A0ABP7M9P7_9GAMM
MQDNPYTAPNARLDAAGAADAVRLYSPGQVAAAGFLGGPVGLIWFLKANFAALGNSRLETKTVVLGVVLLVALVAIMPLLPEQFPGVLFTVVYIFIGRYVAEKYQLTRKAIAESERFTLHSNWRVFGLGLLCLLASVAVIVVPLMLLAASGVWTP